jgi:HPt (histidine-containing phosphotransfer) domain-containing protein
VLDPTVLAASIGDDRETLLDVVASYMITLPEILGKLETALERNDVPAVGAAAHGLKGGAANLGGKRLRHVAAEIEAAAREGDASKCRARVPALRQELTALLTALHTRGWVRPADDDVAPSGEGER